MYGPIIYNYITIKISTQQASSIHDGVMTLNNFSQQVRVASTRAIIKVSGHQHQWFPGVSQVVTM